MEPKRLMFLINLLLITLALYLGVKGVYTFLSFKLAPQAISRTAPLSPTKPEAPALPDFSAYRPIADRNLFNTKTGAGEAARAAADLKLEHLEQTKLKLKLWGTVAGAREGAYAVIEDEAEKKQKLYRLGDSVQNAVVRMILRNKIVLSFQGRDEILETEKPALAKGPGGPVPESVDPESAPAPAPETGAAQRKITLNRDQITSAMGNLNDLMGQATIQPSQDGKGLLVTDIKPNSIFRRMGLRTGDVLTSAGGNPITSVEDAYKLYEGIKSADTVKLEIMRRGRPTVIEYNIK